MNLAFSADELAFRNEVRQFIVENYPDSVRRRQQHQEEPGREDYIAWHRILAQKGWVAPAWPVEYGGTGWTPTQRYIFSEELARADTVPLVPFGLGMVGPVICTFGTAEQKAAHLPGILSGDVWWCQGYSEPGAGSDLASLRTRAERITEDGRDYYRVNGQKTWTTMAQYADWGFFLVRTDPAAKPQAGISFLLIDMKSPGISLKPIITLDGGHEVNEVFLDNVKVPVENRIHDENKGWTCAKFLLAHERTGIAGVARSKREITKLKAIARTQPDGKGGTLIANPFFRRKLVELETDLTALEFTELRTLAGEAAGQEPGPESSLLKVKGSEIQQRITELAMEAAGLYAAPCFRGFPPGPNEYSIGPDFAHRAAPAYFNMRKTSIYGGSNEIQRNIIARMVLGL